MLSSALSTVSSFSPSDALYSAHQVIRSPYVALGICLAWFSSIPLLRHHQLRESRLTTYVTALAAWDALLARVRAEHRRVLVPHVEDQLMRDAMAECDAEDDEEYQDEEDEEEAEEKAEAPAQGDHDDHDAQQLSDEDEDFVPPEARRDHEVVALVLEMPLSTFGTIQAESSDLVAHFSRIIADDFQQLDSADDDDDGDRDHDDDDDDGAAAAAYTDVNGGDGGPPEFTFVDLSVPFSTLVVSPADADQQRLIYALAKAATSVSSASSNQQQQQQQQHAHEQLKSLVDQLSPSVQAATRNRTVLVSFGFLRDLDLGELVRLASFLVQHLVLNRRAEAAATSSIGDEELRTAESICRDVFRLCFAVLVVKHLALELVDAIAAENAAKKQQKPSEGATVAATKKKSRSASGVEEEEEDEAEVASLRERQYKFGQQIAGLLGRYVREVQGAPSTDDDGKREVHFEDTVCVFQGYSSSGAPASSAISLAHMCVHTPRNQGQQPAACLDRAACAARFSQLRRAAALAGAAAPEALFRHRDDGDWWWWLSRIAHVARSAARAAMDSAQHVVSSCVPFVGQMPLLRRAVLWIPPAVLLVNLAGQTGLALLGTVAKGKDSSEKQLAYLHEHDGNNNNSGSGSGSGSGGDEHHHQRPFPPLLEALSRAALGLANLNGIAQLALRATNYSGDCSVSTRMFLYAATADIGRDGASGVFDKATRTLEVVPRLTEAISWATAEPAHALGVMLMVWRHPGLIAVSIALTRASALMTARLERAAGVGELFGAVGERAAAIRRRRIRAAIRSSSGSIMACLDPFLCEPLMIPTRCDGLRLDASGPEAEGGDESEVADAGPAAADAPSLPGVFVYGGGAAPSTAAVVPSAANDGEDGAVGDADDDGFECSWQFPQPENGVELLDTNARHERALRCPTLGLALLACAIIERQKEQPASAAGAAAASEESTAPKAPKSRFARKRRSDRWAKIPPAAAATPSVLLPSPASPSSFSLVRWPSTPLHINTFLAPAVRELCSPSYAAVHDAVGSAMRTVHAAAASESSPWASASRSTFARFVVGRRYSLAPTASAVASLFDARRFRAMRCAGIEVETIVASSVALLPHTVQQLAQETVHNSVDSHLKYTVAGGAQSAALDLIGNAHLKLFPPTPRDDDNDDGEEVSHVGGSVGVLIASVLPESVEDPRVALGVLDQQLQGSALQRAQLDSAYYLSQMAGDDRDFEIAALNAQANHSDVDSMLRDCGETGLSADMLGNSPTAMAAAGPGPGSGSGGAESDPICAWMASETRTARTIDSNRSGGGSNVNGSGSGIGAAPSLSELDWEFRDVCFAYPSDPDRLVLHHVSFRLPARSFVGVIGKSGSSKTTVLALMLRIYEPTRGEILLGGRPLREYAPRWLRRHLAYVGPLCALLGGESANAVQEVAGAAPLLSDEQVTQALRSALVPERMFCPAASQQRLPVISTMSGGEQQRVQIARAFSKMMASSEAEEEQQQQQPQVISLLFDEGTSSLDSKTEEQIVRAITQQQKQTVTRICVAHRIFTVRDCDVLLIMFRGRLVARGTFRECLLAAQRALRGDGAQEQQQQQHSETTLRGLRWFLRSVKAQALRDEADLPDLGALVTPTASSSALLSATRSGVIRDDDNDNENDNESASDAHEDEEEAEEEEAPQHDDDNVDADGDPIVAQVLSTIASVPPSMREKLGGAIAAQLGDDAAAAWKRLLRRAKFA